MCYGTDLLHFFFSSSGHLRHGSGLICIKLPKRHNSAEICRKTLQLGNCGKPDDPHSVFTSSVNYLGRVTNEGLITVKMFRVKWGI